MTVPLRYRERPPHPALDAHLACVWSGAVRQGQRILPDGCIDIVWIGDSRLTVAGPDTGPNLTDLTEGTLTVGVRFRPGRAPAFLEVRADELTDQSFDLDELWDGDCAELVQRLADAPSVEAKEALLQAALLRRLDDAPDPDAAIDAAVDVIAASPSAARVGEISREVGVSERHLRRRFEQAVGYGPKTLGRVLRFRRFLSLAEDDGVALARAAAEAGYADQPHLTRECNDLAGLPPAELLAARSVRDVRDVTPSA